MGPLWPSSPVFPEALSLSRFRPSILYKGTYPIVSSPLLYMLLYSMTWIQTLYLQNLAQHRLLKNSTLGVTGSCLLADCAGSVDQLVPVLNIRPKNIVQYPLSKDWTGSHCSQLKNIIDIYRYSLVNIIILLTFATVTIKYHMYIVYKLHSLYSKIPMQVVSSIKPEGLYPHREAILQKGDTYRIGTAITQSVSAIVIYFTRLVFYQSGPDIV